MTDSEREAGLIDVLVQRLEQQRLPRALDIKAMVDRGERLSGLDINFLDESLQDAIDVKGFFDQHPEWQDLGGRMIHLYKEITTKALENEQSASATRVDEPGL
jgi:hypothetical protein